MIDKNLLARIGKLETSYVGSSDLRTLGLDISNTIVSLLPLARNARRVTMNEDYVVSGADPSLIVLDCNGGERTLVLPQASRANKPIVIINSSA